MTVNQPFSIRKNKTSLYLARKTPKCLSVRLGIIQPHFQGLSQETWGRMSGGAGFLY